MEQLSPAALPATVLLLTSEWYTKAVVHSMYEIFTPEIVTPEIVTSSRA